jgi:hypothetical protein
MLCGKTKQKVQRGATARTSIRWVCMPKKEDAFVEFKNTENQIKTPHLLFIRILSV